MTRSKRPTHAQLLARGRLIERGAMLALLDAMITGVPRLAEKYRAVGQEGDVDFALHEARLRALHGTICAGAHVGLGEGELPEALA